MNKLEVNNDIIFDIKKKNHYYPRDGEWKFYYEIISRKMPNSVLKLKNMRKLSMNYLGVFTINYLSIDFRNFVNRL